MQFNSSKSAPLGQANETLYLTGAFHIGRLAPVGTLLDPVGPGK